MKKTTSSWSLEREPHSIRWVMNREVWALCSLYSFLEIVLCFNLKLLTADVGDVASFQIYINRCMLHHMLH